MNDRLEVISLLLKYTHPACARRILKHPPFYPGSITREMRYSPRKKERRKIEPKCEQIYKASERTPIVALAQSASLLLLEAEEIN